MELDLILFLVATDANEMAFPEDSMRRAERREEVDLAAFGDAPALLDNDVLVLNAVPTGGSKVACGDLNLARFFPAKPQSAQSR